MKVSDNLHMLDNQKLLQYDNSTKHQFKIQYQKDFGSVDHTYSKSEMQIALNGRTKSYHYSYKDFRSNIQKPNNKTFCDQNKTSQKNFLGSYDIKPQQKELLNEDNKCVSYMANKTFSNIRLRRNQTYNLIRNKNYEQDTEQDESSASEKYEIYVADDLDQIVQKFKKAIQSQHDDNNHNPQDNKQTTNQMKSQNNDESIRLTDLKLNDRLKYLQNRNNSIVKKQYRNKIQQMWKQNSSQNYNKIDINFARENNQTKTFNQHNSQNINKAEIQTPSYSIQLKNDIRKIRSSSASRKLPVRQQPKSIIPLKKTSTHVYVVVECKK